MELMEPLTEEEQDEIYAEAGYKREQLELDLTQIREWLQGQHHLPPSRLKESDNFLKTYLIGCKGSFEKMKRKLDAYYTFRNNFAIFQNRDPLDEKYIKSCKLQYTCISPRLHKSKEFILFFINNNCDSEDFNVLRNMKNIINVLEILMRSHVICGIHYVVDMKPMAFKHSYLLSPALVKELIDIIQHVLPHQVKGMYLFNVHPVMVSITNNIIKPFLSKKLTERYHVFSGDYEELYQFLDKSVLPKEYGGEIPKTLKEITDVWHEEERLKRDWFLNELSEKTDESRRIIVDNSLVENAYFGVYGSLKTLCID